MHCTIISPDVLVLGLFSRFFTHSRFVERCWYVVVIGAPICFPFVGRFPFYVHKQRLVISRIFWYYIISRSSPKKWYYIISYITILKMIWIISHIISQIIFQLQKLNTGGFSHNWDQQFWEDQHLRGCVFGALAKKNLLLLN